MSSSTIYAALGSLGPLRASAGTPDLFRSWQVEEKVCDDERLRCGVEKSGIAISEAVEEAMCVSGHAYVVM